MQFIFILYIQLCQELLACKLRKETRNTIKMEEYMIYKCYCSLTNQRTDLNYGYKYTS